VATASSGKHFKKCGLAGPIGTGKTYYFCLFNAERYIAKNLATSEGEPNVRTS
jgi:hypothetical protein